MKTYLTNLKYNLKRFFRNLYANRYGYDDLNKTLLYLAFGLSIINVLFKSNILNSLSTVAFILFIFRFFSKNKYKRSDENRWFRHKVKYFKLAYESRKTYRIYECKHCGQFMRVPKGAGKVVVTCPKCNTEQEHRA